METRTLGKGEYEVKVDFRVCQRIASWLLASARDCYRTKSNSSVNVTQLNVEPLRKQGLIDRKSGVLLFYLLLATRVRPLRV